MTMTNNKSKSSKDAFIRLGRPDAATEDRLGYDVLDVAVNGRGWELQVIRMPYYDSIFEFVQVGHPNGTTSYFTYDGDDPRGFRAGPFGGGYSWTVPKYVLAEVEALIDGYFAPSDEGVEALLEEAAQCEHRTQIQVTDGQEWADCVHCWDAGVNVHPDER